MSGQSVTFAATNDHWGKFVAIIQVTILVLVVNHDVYCVFCETMFLA